MKKLKLKFDGMKSMLSKEQMKAVTGGYSSSSSGGGGVYGRCVVCFCSSPFADCFYTRRTTQNLCDRVCAAHGGWNGYSYEMNPCGANCHLN